VSKRLASRPKLPGECASEFDTKVIASKLETANSWRDLRRARSPLQTHARKITEHSPIESKPDLDPSIENQGVQIWAGTRNASCEVSSTNSSRSEHRDLKSGVRRLDITDAFKPAIELPWLSPDRNKDQIVVFFDATGFFIDIANLSCQKKTNSFPRQAGGTCASNVLAASSSIEKVRVRLDQSLLSISANQAGWLKSPVPTN